MHRQLLTHIDVLATMDNGGDNGGDKGCGRELTDAAVLIDGNVITKVGPTSALEQEAASCDEVHNLAGHIVLPGLVNTHHHLFQNLTRVVPDAQNHSLFGWLQTLYPIWSHLQPEDIYVAAATGLAELALSGCTTSSDHQYLFPHGSRLDDSIEAAHDVGIRFTATRGSMSIGESKGGLPPDQLTEAENSILEDCLRLIDAYHDASAQAMTQIALAPCSPFSVSTGLMRDTADMAKDKGVGLHTHLAENVEDIDYSLAQFGQRPGDYAEELGWTGAHVWHAHCVQLNEEEINLFARTKTGVAHCPCSNMRLASGIAPVRQMIDAGVPVGLGVDGSSSSDSGHLMNEARQAMLLQRVLGGADNLSARQALRLATRGGAEVLNRHDIGQIAPGFGADMAIFSRNCIELSGTQTDPLAGLVFCGPVKPRHVLINGKWVVREHQLTTLSLPDLLDRHHRCATDLLNRSQAG
ncbi:MAG TPA: 8-oxoguanine deaminase [Alphaproteobacteria bacterium]|nr:8-oxoguanine deaminase [Alphaproteobacteria bacterium]